MATTIYFDLETGGVEAWHPDIQIAAVAVAADWTELASFERKIRFDPARANPAALEMNHYDAETWAREAVTERDASRAFAAFLEPHRHLELLSKKGKPYLVAQLAGHNAASFDGPRLQRMFHRNDLFLPASFHVMCTLQRALWADTERGVAPGSLRLGELCKRFGIEHGNAHDALADVRATVAVARALTSKET